MYILKINTHSSRVQDEAVFLKIMEYHITFIYYDNVLSPNLIYFMWGLMSTSKIWSIVIIHLESQSDILNIAARIELFRQLSNLGQFLIIRIKR